jgi:hypothetical protein
MIEPIQIGDRRQLFIDNRFVHQAEGVDQKLQLPYLPCENLLVPDKPWESARAGPCCSVIYHDDRFRMWYEALDGECLSLCYAESDDGVHFVRPRLSLVDHKGISPTNILLDQAVVGANFFVDPFDTEDRRYKGLGSVTPRDQNGNCRSRFGDSQRLLTSADGIHWSVATSPVLPMHTGSTPSTAWDERRGTWAIYLGAHTPKRCYARTEVLPGELHRDYPFTPRPGIDYTGPGERSPRLEHELPIVLAADDGDPPGTEICSMDALKYPWADDAYLAFPAMWYAGGSNRQDSHLAISRDGIAWRRPWREPVIPCGLEGTQSAGRIYPTRSLIRRGGEVWLYYSGCPDRHTSTAALCRSGLTARAIWRLDGFVAMVATRRGGRLITPPLVFNGNRLRLNANASGAGEIRVGLRRAEGEPIPGFGLGEADPLYGNGLELEASWRHSADVGCLAGEPVQVEFALQACKLYAFGFAAQSGEASQPDGATP